MRSTKTELLTRFLGRPFVQIAVYYALFLVATLPARHGAVLFGMGATLAGSITLPIAFVFHRRFAIGLLAAVSAWMALFIAVVATCDALLGPLGDDSMGFLPAFMLFPPAILVAIVVRLVARRNSPPSPSS